VAQVQDLSASPALQCQGGPVPAPYFPVVRPWAESRALDQVESVFPPMVGVLHWLAARLHPRAWIVLNVLLLLQLALVMRRTLSPLAAAAVLAPLAFYAGTNWELVLLAAVLVAAVQWRDRPWTLALLGLLPALRPDSLPFVLLVLADLLRRRQHTGTLTLLASTLGFLGVNAAFSGSLLPPHLTANYHGAAPAPLANAAGLLLAGPGLLAWLSLPALALLALALRRRSAGWEAAAVLLLAGLLCWRAAARPLFPDAGALLVAPLALLYAFRWKDLAARHGRLLAAAPLAWLVVVVLATPVARGFHFGPRLLLPPLLLMTWMAVREQEGRGMPRLLSWYTVGVALAGLILLKVRQGELARQEESLHGATPMVLTSRFQVPVEYLDAMEGHCVLHTATAASYLRVASLAATTEERLALVAAPGDAAPAAARAGGPYRVAGETRIAGGLLTPDLLLLSLERRHTAQP